jgi:glutamate--cysteine ligase
MQAISGIHYNFSLADEAWALLRPRDSAIAPEIHRDQGYLALIRNFRRHSWLLILLLGSAPAACSSFVAGRKHRLAAWEGGGTAYAPGATSLRMGTLGYQSDAQSALGVSFNDLHGYADTLQRAMSEPYPPYEAIGLRDADGYRQLSTALLQIENEFYGKIRPKRVTRPGERPLHALGERGIEYVEVRCLDVDPFMPLGIDAAAIRLLDVFLFYCLLADSPHETPAEIAAVSRNQTLVAEAGRDPHIRLDRRGASVAPVDWSRELLHECEPVAAALDDAQGGTGHREALASAQRTLDDLASLPSARALRAIEESHGRSFADFALAQSRRHREEAFARPLSAEAEARYAQLAAQSLAEQAGIESADDMPFEAYRRRYLEQDLLSGPHLAG